MAGESFLAKLLDCGKSDLELLDEIYFEKDNKDAYDIYCEVSQQINGNVTFEHVLVYAFQKALKNMKAAIEKKIDNLTADDIDEIEVLKMLNPEEDITINFNYRATQVYCIDNSEIYALNDDLLDKFHEETGFYIQGIEF